jgi:hypothetical protein
MLALGLLCIAFGIFFLWVMFHGQDFISPEDAKDWTKSWGDVAKALGQFFNPAVNK